MTLCWKELILDLGSCNIFKFDRKSIERYLAEVCDILKMKREDLHWWDYEDDPEGYEEAPDHLKGVSAIQFITTSNITIHTIDTSEMVFLNIFSCKEFNPPQVADFSCVFFEGRIIRAEVIIRG